jgi:long-chain acyl-CoA synthetase
MADASIKPALRFQHALLERTVLSTARRRAGLNKCSRSFSAAAPLDAEVIRFFHALGLKIAEGYGQSETCGPTTWNPPDAIRIGTVGTALSGLTLRIADDGEVLVKGGNTSPGYYEDPTASAELYDDDGWLHSGDLGRLDELGYLQITDRKKDLLITASGKNVAPQQLENLLRRPEIVSQAVVIGEGRPYLTALVTLDVERVVDWARDHGIPGDESEIARNERTLKEIEVAMDELNAAVSRPEQLKKLRVLERDFAQEADEITPTLKVKRRRIEELYSDVIEEMYGPDAPRITSASRPADPVA